MKLFTGISTTRPLKTYRDTGQEILQKLLIFSPHKMNFKRVHHSLLSMGLSSLEKSGINHAAGTTTEEAQIDQQCATCYGLVWLMVTGG